MIFGASQVSGSHPPGFAESGVRAYSFPSTPFLDCHISAPDASRSGRNGSMKTYINPPQARPPSAS